MDEDPMGKLIEMFDGSIWKIFQQDAGMGEKDYAAFLNDVFFCRTEHLITAQEIIKAVRFKAGYLEGGITDVIRRVNPK